MYDILMGAKKRESREKERQRAVTRLLAGVEWADEEEWVRSEPPMLQLFITHVSERVV